jgi:hypothetical protein
MRVFLLFLKIDGYPTFILAIRIYHAPAHTGNKSYTDGKSQNGCYYPKKVSERKIPALADSGCNGRYEETVQHTVCI